VSRVLLIFLLAFAVLQSALAATVHVDGSTVVVNGMPVLRLRTAVGGATPEKRAQIFAGNVERTADLGEVTTKKAGTSWLILIGDQLVLTVTPQEAAASNSTPPALATTWAANLRSALTMPALKVGTTSVKMPLGESRTVSFVGTYASSASIDTGDAKVAAIERTPGNLVVRGVGVGKTEIVISAAGVVKVLSVKVMPYAALFPQTVQANVTGLPATSEIVRGAIDGAVRSQFATANGAEFTYSIPPAGDLMPGDSRSYAVRVKAYGPDMLTMEGTVQVAVKNLALGRTPEAQLWYCNEPENLKGPGMLFAAPLRPEAPARLLYHHINEMASPLIVKVEAVNNSDQSARLMLIPGDSQPDRNPVLAGYQAADQFLRSWMVNAGEVITVPPHTSLPISMRRIAHGRTVSGLCYLRLLDGGPSELIIRADAQPPFSVDKKYAAALESSAPWRVIGPQRVTLMQRDAVAPSLHVYPNPFKDGQMSYEVGGKYGFFRLGERAIKRADNLKSLDGNFGVTYQITANMENPTSEAQEIELVFEASAGYTGALFVVNGQVVRTPLLQPKTEAQVMKFHLGPGLTRQVSITTVPLSGSSYPATLTLRPVGERVRLSAKRSSGEPTRKE
jgi:hypothetical protein